MGEPRPGERRLAFDPAAAGDATLAFIGRIRTPHGPGACPKNLREARAAGGGATVEVEAPYREGLSGVVAGDAVVLLYWMGGARRDLVVQAPRHRDGPAGVFALRSPARPNPVAMAVVRLIDMDRGAGLLYVDAIDCWDNTPLIDIKPFLPSVDIPPDANAQ